MMNDEKRHREWCHFYSGPPGPAFALRAMARQVSRVMTREGSRAMGDKGRKVGQRVGLL